MGGEVVLTLDIDITVDGCSGGWDVAYKTEVEAMTWYFASYQST